MPNRTQVAESVGSLEPGKVEIRPAFPEVPELLIGRTAAGSGAFPENRHGKGARVLTGSACGLEERSVRSRAFGELVERVSAVRSGFERRTTTRRARYTELEAEGCAALSPRILQQFAPWQNLPDEIERNPEDHCLTWCVGRDPVQQREVLVPALVAFLHWSPPPGEPIFVAPGATGLAAGLDAEAAQCRGLLEVIERSACMRSWRTEEAMILALDTVVVPPAYRHVCEALGLAAELYALSTPDLPLTVLGLVSRPDGTCLTVGSACCLRVAEAVEKALQEGFMLQRTMRGVAMTADAFARPRNSLEHVARAYSCGTSVRDWYRARAFRCDWPLDQVFDWTFTELATRAARSYQCEVVSVETTDTLARALGFSVFRVVVPGALMKESDCTIPHLGRYASVEGVDRRPEVGRPQVVRSEPHPFG